MGTAFHGPAPRLGPDGALEFDLTDAGSRPHNYGCLDPGRPERRELLRCLALGSTLAAACASAGLSRDTVFEHRRSDPDFAREYEEAQARAEVRYNRVVYQAAEKQWQAAAWWLERRRPESYALVTHRDTVFSGRLEVDQRVEVNIKREIEQYAEDLAAFAQECAEAELADSILGPRFRQLPALPEGPEAEDAEWKPAGDQP